MGGKGDVVYMRGIAGHPADTDRDTGFKKALAEYPGITVVRDRSHRVGPGDGRPADQRLHGQPARSSTASGRPASTRHRRRDQDRQQAVVPIVGADNAGFVDPAPQRAEGLTGAAVTNPASVGGAGVALALQILERHRRRPRRPSTSPRSCGTTQRRAGKAKLTDGQTTRTRTTWPLGSRSRTGRRTARTSSSPARARASSPDSRVAWTQGMPAPSASPDPRPPPSIRPMALPR